MTVSGELCCVALPFCCVVIVALPFSASLEATDYSRTHPLYSTLYHHTVCTGVAMVYPH